MAPKIKVPEGGFRQRLKRADAEAGQKYKSSKTAICLLGLWASGLMSPHLVQTIAFAAQQDIEVAFGEACPFQEINFLAGLLQETNFFEVSSKFPS